MKKITYILIGVIILFSIIIGILNKNENNNNNYDTIKVADTTLTSRTYMS